MEDGDNIHISSILEYDKYNRYIFQNTIEHE